MRITRLSTRECLAVEYAGALPEEGAAWLKLPGRAPIRVFTHANEDGALVCEFAQPLYPSEVACLLSSHQARATASRVRPRCTFLA